MAGSVRTVTIFDWLSFARGVELDQEHIDGKALFIFLDQVDDTTCRVLVFRAWYHVGGVLKCYVGDRMSGPLTVWVRAARFLIELGQLATKSGATLQWGDLTNPDALPVAENDPAELTPAPIVGPDLFTAPADSSGG